MSVNLCYHGGEAANIVCTGPPGAVYMWNLSCLPRAITAMSDSTCTITQHNHLIGTVLIHYRYKLFAFVYIFLSCQTFSLAVLISRPSKEMSHIKDDGGMGGLGLIFSLMRHHKEPYKHCGLLDRRLTVIN